MFTKTLQCSFVRLAFSVFKALERFLQRKPIRAVRLFENSLLHA
jgi:hypothetical protein